VIPDGTILGVNCIVSVTGGRSMACQVIYVDHADVVLVGIASTGRPFTVRMPGQAVVVAEDFRRRAFMEPMKGGKG